ncbi:translation initiation factor IF-2 [Candidatus Gracilibacteria bacterium]|nr:translation initiation factor IF-2 [Candidatus Gracilibacteria bacterium]MCF7898490.1 translation initiation factor IF-2 [Candidatus Paceibacterota bacterium]
MSKTSTVKGVSRQPVIAVLGHVDHGKSSLLDFIRKSNIVDGEAGGITQRISAYEVQHKLSDGTIKPITFLDTPGHAAFQNMRERGVEIADIAILIVSAEDGVKAQTVEAWKTIDAHKLPYVVAINKIDKPGADIQKTKNSLVENGIYIEGYGGEVPCVEISAKAGTGVDSLLETLLLLVDMNELTANLSTDATGYVLESFVDQKRGVSATLIIKDGTLATSGAIVAGTSFSPIRIVEDFIGRPIKSPHAGQPIKVTGFDDIPASGSIFVSSSDKKMMEQLQSETKLNTVKTVLDPRLYRNAKVVIPVVIKADSLGTLDAVKSELKKSETDDIKIKIIAEGVGTISEGDIMLASSDEKTIIIGFAVKMEGKARDQADRFNIKPELFDIIYKLSEWFTSIVESRLPYEENEVVLGTIKILRTFSSQKDKHVIGGRVETGKIINNSVVKIIRRGLELGRGRIVELQAQKLKTDVVNEGNECGLMVESKFEIIQNDILENIQVEKTRA